MDIKAEILELEEKLRLAMISSDVKTLEDLIFEGLVFVGPDGSVVSKQMDLAAHRSGMQKITKLEPSEQSITVYSDFAIVTVKMELCGTYQGFSIDGNYRYTRVWSKINDRLQVVSGAVVKIL